VHGAVVGPPHKNTDSPPLMSFWAQVNVGGRCTGALQPFVAQLPVDRIAAEARGPLALPVLETAGTSANPIDGNAGLTGLTFNNRLADGFQFSRGARDSIAEGNYVALTQPLPEYRITSSTAAAAANTAIDRMAFVRWEAARLRGNVGCAMGAQSHRFGTVAQTH